MKRIVIGRKDIADFEKLQLFGVEVKVDTGAYTSSFHCCKIEKVTKDGSDWVKCNFLDPGHPKYHEKEFCFEIFRTRKVKSSNGMVEERFSIVTEVSIFKKKYPIELTLTERTDMKSPVLLGRKFLSKKFIIDTAKKNLSLKEKIIEIDLPKKEDR